MTKETFYPKNILYEKYLELFSTIYNPYFLKNRTQKTTLENMGYAINNCENWDTFLDIGGGTGHYSAALSSCFKKGLLIEIDSQPEHKLITEKYPNISAIYCQIENYEPSYKADFILLADVFEHIPDILSFVKKLSSMQEKGGVIYIMTPNPITCGPAPESEIYYKIHKYGHIKHYNGNEICLLMSQWGYEYLYGTYEGTKIRTMIKTLFYALLQKDSKWSHNIIYKITRLLIKPFLLIINNIFEKIIYFYETRNRYNPFTTRTQTLVFKKIN